MVWQRKGVVAGGRKLIGATNPAESAPGTIRGDLALDVGRFVEFFLFIYLLEFLFNYSNFQKRHSRKRYC
jgi:nucleoside diphosphate kinase